MRKSNGPNSMQIAVLHTDHNQPLLAGLIQLYLYDLSEHELADIGPNGQFADTLLRSELAKPNSQAFIIQKHTTPIGFALVGCENQPPVSDIYSISAFFILRRYRRQGMGRLAAFQLFEHFPGRWKIGTFGANTPAVSFWRHVINSYTSGSYDESWMQNAHWRGSVQTFTVSKAPDS